MSKGKSFRIRVFLPCIEGLWKQWGFTSTSLIALVWGVSMVALEADAPANGPEKHADQSMVPDTLTVMTFNVRYTNVSDGLNAWPVRKQAVGGVVRNSGADIAGFQEVLKSQLEDLKQELPEFDFVGVGRDDGQDAGEFSPIFYRRERFRVKSWQTIWLSPTPEKPSSGWDASLRRIATVVHFQDKQSGQAFWVVNTHFDHSGASARLESAKLLRDRLGQFENDVAVVLMGDFNCGVDSPPYRELTQDQDGGAFRDTRTLVEEPLGPDSTWNGFDKIVPGRRIDFVFLRGPWQTLKSEIIDARRGKRFVSDHLPVVAQFELDNKQAQP